MIFLPLTAQAGWRFAEWGMSKDELIAASNGEAGPHYEQNRESWGEYPAAKSEAHEMGHKFEAWYYIDPYDGLYAIRLVPQGLYWCIDIRDRAMQRWGYRDLRHEDGDPVWKMPETNNRVSIIGFRGCTVKLEPLDPEKIARGTR
ncbi:MAG: hypothetical protein ACMVY4_02230 [Minwuia sp.]|uniref:hypothetical protein n=1 Tax=Minwuia sp. TaxID=2493630 RepID=UPI003A8A7FE9